MAVYLQVPFQQPPSPSRASEFVSAVAREIERRASLLRPPVRTLYVGGGRPSLLSPSALGKLVEACRPRLGTSPTGEVSLNLHPSDASPSYLTALRRIGVTRLNIDDRSSDDETLPSILQRARASALDRLSVDLAFGGPHQSRAAWKACLHQVVNLRVPHVALHEYALPETPSTEAERADRFAFAMRILSAKGYEQYELTHFARPGHRSQYQAHVYAHGNVLGLGPGAETFRWPDRADPSTAERWANVHDVSVYVERLRDDESVVAQRESLDRPALAREYILLRLRTREGVDLDRVENRYGCPLRREKSTTLNRLTAEGLIYEDPDRVRLTPRGRLLADAITQRLTRAP